MNRKVYERPPGMRRVQVPPRVARVDASSTPLPDVPPVVAVRQAAECFVTPPALVARMMATAVIAPWHSVLEPSAGTGAILRALPGGCTAVAIEREPALCEVLRGMGYDVQPSDFLQLDPERMRTRFDRVLMNPPFSNLQDTRHVRHAFQFLKPGGRLVAITSPSWLTSQRREALIFRDWFRRLDGIAETLPPGSFKASGTMAAALLLTIDRRD